MSVSSDDLSLLGSPQSSVMVLTPSVSLKRDEFFYFQNVVFQVEDTLFNVPRYGQTIDSAFDALFKSQEDDVPAGVSDEDPIMLNDATASEFRLLLKILFPPPGVESEVNTAEFTMDDWISVLRISTDRGLTTVRDAVIARSKAEVNSLPVVDKILLAQRFDVEPWLDEAREALVVREAGITFQEREKLGWEAYGLLMDLRERQLSKKLQEKTEEVERLSRMKGKKKKPLPSSYGGW